MEKSSVNQGKITSKNRAQQLPDRAQQVGHQHNTKPNSPNIAKRFSARAQCAYDRVLANVGFGQPRSIIKKGKKDFWP